MSLTSSPELEGRILRLLAASASEWLDKDSLYRALNVTAPPVLLHELSAVLQELVTAKLVHLRLNYETDLTEFRLSFAGVEKAKEVA